MRSATPWGRSWMASACAPWCTSATEPRRRGTSMRVPTSPRCSHLQWCSSARTTSGPSRCHWPRSPGRWRSCSSGCTRMSPSRWLASGRRLSGSPGRTVRVAPMAEVTMVKALNHALRDSLAEDDRMLLFGEDVGRLGGVFRVTDGLQSEFGSERVFDTPLAEAGIAGVSVGLCMAGWDPVSEMQFDGFSYPALDQIISHVAKYRYRSRGRQPMPMVIRIPYAGGYGGAEPHNDSPESHLAHTAGLKVVTPSTAVDAYRLLRASIADPDPVIFLEPKSRYWSKETGELSARANGNGTLPFGQ